MALLDELQNTRPDLAAQFRTLHAEALRIWSQPLPGYVREFTSHGEPHIEQIQRNLDALTQNLQDSPRRLSPEEIFVLLAAASLHDVGMLVDAPDARSNHAQYSYELILNSHTTVTSGTRRLSLPIEDANARETIASIARGHWASFAIDLQQEDYIHGVARGRLRFLGCLLAMADLLDLSPVRAWAISSRHHLFDLDALSELHQITHSLVRGFRIVPPTPEVRTDLQFQLQWRDDSEETRLLSRWMCWPIEAYWRRLEHHLLVESDGMIRWATPWISVTFEPPSGPSPTLPASSRKVLDAEYREQRRIDRDDFVAAFHESLEKGTRQAFLCSSGTETDGVTLVEWSRAQLAHRDNVLTAKIDLVETAPMDLSTVVAEVLEQWGKHIGQTSAAEAIEELRHFMADHADEGLAIIVKSSTDEQDLLIPVLELLFDPDNSVSSVPRIAVIASRNPDDLRMIGDTDYLLVNPEPLEKEDVVTFLSDRMGYREPRITEIVDRMEQMGIMALAGSVYTYLHLHCTTAQD